MRRHRFLQPGVGLQGGPGRLLLQGGSRGKADSGAPDRERQRRQPCGRESPAGLPELPGRHRGAALLPALEKRSV